MNEAQPKPWVLAVCAAESNAGKTMWVCALVRALTQAGYRVGTVKHTHKDFDVPGKDSARHRDAGACRVVLSAQNGRAVLIPEPERALTALIASDFSDVDAVLVEGYRSAGVCIPKAFVGSLQECEGLENVVALLPRVSGPVPEEDATRALAGLLESLGRPGAG